jgi:hypothetical protein
LGRFAPIFVDAVFQLDDCKITDFNWDGMVKKNILYNFNCMSSVIFIIQGQQLIPVETSGTCPASPRFEAAQYQPEPAVDPSLLQELVY